MNDVIITLTMAIAHVGFQFVEQGQDLARYVGVSWGIVLQQQNVRSENSLTLRSYLFIQLS